MKAGIGLLFLFAAVSALINDVANAADVPRMTKDELKGLLGKPGVTVVDVRTARDWDGSVWKIEGAMRGDPEDVKSWMENLGRDDTVVLYCA